MQAFFSKGDNMKNKEKVKKTFYVSCVATGGLILGWYLHIFTESKIPYSYRTENIVLDTLAALGIRNYNP